MNYFKLQGDRFWQNKIKNIFIIFLLCFLNAVWINAYADSTQIKPSQIQLRPWPAKGFLLESNRTRSFCGGRGREAEHCNDTLTQARCPNNYDYKLFLSPYDADYSRASVCPVRQIVLAPTRLIDTGTSYRLDFGSAYVYLFGCDSDQVIYYYWAIYCTPKP